MNFNIKSVNKFESMLKTNSFLFFDSNEFEEIIMYYLDTGNIPLAKKAGKLAFEQYPSSISLNLIIAEISIVENNLKKAEKINNKLHQLEPLNAEILFQKSKILSKKKKHLESIESLKKIEKNSDLFYDSLYTIGKEYLYIDDFKNAKDTFINCLKINSNDLLVINNLLFCFDSIGNVKETIDFLNNFLESNPYCEICWHHLGKQYVKVKDDKKALVAFEYAVICDESFEGAYIEIGKLYEKSKKINSAIENYEMSMSGSGPNSYSLYRIGRCYEKLYNQKLAKKYFSKVVEIDPLHSKAWMKISEYFFNENKYSISKEFILKSIEIDPDKKKFWELFLKISIQIDSKSEIKLAIEKIIKIERQQIDSILHLTNFCIGLNNTDVSEILKTKILKICEKTRNHEFKYLLSVLSYKLEKKSEALDYLKIAYTNCPEKFNFYRKNFKDIPAPETFMNIS